MTKPCIICGNGPSALNIPVNPIVPIFGMNYSYVTPDFYVAIDTSVLLYHWQEIYPLAAHAQIAFLSAFHDGSSPLYDLGNVKLIAKDDRSFKAEQFMSGLTASYVALKCAYYLGFDEVHLFGIDHSPDWKHYREDYPAPSVDIRSRMKMMLFHYQLAADVYARAGRIIINHSNPSALDRIFQRAKAQVKP